MIRRLARLTLICLVACGCVPEASVACANKPPEGYAAFHSPTKVTIENYDDDAMEPFMSRDGRFLFFNNSNDPQVDTNIHFAESVSASRFIYRGLLEGANSTALDGVPTMDIAGALYFVSTRSYDQSLETIHRGNFSGQSLSGPVLVEGISRRQRGWLNFDVEVSADGRTIYYSVGLFTGDPVPHEADLAVAHQSGDMFKKETGTVFEAINTSDLEYAAAISKDELELFFTRFSQGGLAIYRATRPTANQPFGSVQPVSAAVGHVEAPTLSPDERLLYYHRKGTDGRFRIYSVSR